MIRARRARPVALSLSLHGLLFAALVPNLYSAARFDVEAGSAPIELTLAASLSRPSARSAPASPPVARPVDPVADVAAAEPGAEPRSADADAATSPLAGDGAVTEARAAYRRNPAPVYPERARRNGERGVVLLRVDVGPRGEVVAVRVARTSGHERLDSAALRAVRGWIFEPATAGGRPIASTIEIPVRFELETP